MRRSLSLSLSVAAVLLLLAASFVCACMHDNIEEWEVARTGDRVPAFKVSLSDGTTYDSTVRDGRGATIVFFATWCDDCQRELPVLDQLYRQGYFDGQHVVCISREEDEATVAAFWREHAFSLPYSAQTDRAIYSLFANAGVPRIYTISADGFITNISFTAPQ